MSLSRFDLLVGVRAGTWYTYCREGVIGRLSGDKLVNVRTAGTQTRLLGGRWFVTRVGWRGVRGKGTFPVEHTTARVAERIS